MGNRLSPGDLRRIIARSMFLSERLAAMRGPGVAAMAPGDQAPDAMVEARWTRWRQAVADGDELLFQKRLEWDGLDMETARRALETGAGAPGEPPPWAALLADLLQAVDDASMEAAEAAASMDAFLDPSAPLPFEEIWAPFVRLASARVRAAVPGAHGRFTKSAWAAVERELLARLAQTGVGTLYEEFSIFRTARQSPLARAFARLAPETSRSLYQAYVAGLFQGGLRELCLNFPVLARQLAVLTQHWIAANVEFLERLEADWDELTRFAGNRRLTRVAGVQADLSDPHNGGRRVLILTLSAITRSPETRTEARVVYKPRSVGSEAAFSSLIAWLNTRGAPVNLYPLAVLDKGTYGWVEFAPHKPCARPAGIRRYYERAGALLCLLHALAAVDAHEENIVASGEHPVLVDAETLMHPEARPFGPDEMLGDAWSAAGDRVRDSVLQTGMLPHWSLGTDGSSYDVGGLSSESEEVPTRTVAYWEAANTDGMIVRMAPLRVRERHNLPRWGEQRVGPGEFVPQVCAGFEKMYRFLLGERDRLLAPGGPLAAFERQTVRFVLRHTYVYSFMGERAFRPTNLRDGLDWSIELEQLYRGYLVSERRPDAWALAALERAAMEQGDIPYFTVPTDGTSVRAWAYGASPRAGGPARVGTGANGSAAAAVRVEGVLEGPPYARAADRLRRLDEDDLALQLGYIRGALFASRAVDGHAGSSRRQSAAGVDAPVAKAAEPRMEPDELLREAEGIGELVRSQAVIGRDGSAVWIALNRYVVAERLRLEQLTPDLYSGVTGVALFLAALEAAGARGFRELTLGALGPVRREVREGTLPWLWTPTPEWLGGASGIGSLVYGLLVIGRLLGDESLLDDSCRLARSVPESAIARAVRLDVVSGVAGLLLALVALYEAVGDEQALALATRCGRHLLDKREAVYEGHKVWPTMDGQPACGFAHGAAGIAYALARLYRHTGDDGLRAAVLEALAFERAAFSEEEGNWPMGGLSPGGPRRFMNGWCHGAPGILLARVGCMAALGEAPLSASSAREDIEAALQIIGRADDLPAHLCCGRAGHAEALWTAGRVLERPELLDQARRIMARIVHARRSRGVWAVPGAEEGVPPSPGFFQGTTGIGYTLLRLAEPQTPLPNVLLWEI